MARQRGTSGRRVGSDGGSGAVGARGEPGAGAEGEQEAEAEGEAGGVPLTAAALDTRFSQTGHMKDINEAIG